MPNQFIYHPDPNEVIRINVEPVRRLAGRLYKSAPGYLRGRNPETGDQEADTEEGGLLSALDIDDTDDDEASLPGGQTEAETAVPAEQSPEKAAASKVSPARQRAMTFFEEMVYAGQRGLSDAQRTYNPAQGASFNTHATRRVCGAMLDFITEESGGAVRVSRGTRRFINEIHEAQNQLRHDLSREPEIDEVTEYLKQSREMPVEQVAQVLDARKQALSEGAAKLEELAKKIADRSGIPFAKVKRVLLMYNDIARKNPANATPEKIAERLIVTQEKVTLGFILMTTRYEVVEPPDSDEDQDDWRGGWGVASAELSPEETFLREECVRALEAAIRSLPNELQRKVCDLKLFEGLDPGEIAERLSLSKDALKTPTHRAFEQLRQSPQLAPWVSMRYWRNELPGAVDKVIGSLSDLEREALGQACAGELSAEAMAKLPDKQRKAIEKALAGAKKKLNAQLKCFFITLGAEAIKERLANDDKLKQFASLPDVIGGENHV